nr:hypothetical protein [Tanacetum cinerariifolium]
SFRGKEFKVHHLVTFNRSLVTENIEANRLVKDQSISFHITFAMSTQQDIYIAGFKYHPPMVNKDNCVPWSSHLLRDPDREVSVAETLHKQIDDELTNKEVKKMEADDQSIQTILIGLPEDIYDAVDSCETA